MAGSVSFLCAPVDAWQIAASDGVVKFILLHYSTLWRKKETGTSAHDVIVGYFWSFDVYCFPDV